MKNLKFQILLLLLFLIGAQTLNAQDQITIHDAAFSMTVTYVSGNAQEEEYEITVTPKDIEAGEKVVVTDDNKNRREECSSNSCTFTWDFDKLQDVFLTVTIGCFVEDERGFRSHFDSCKVIIEPAGG